MTAAHPPGLRAETVSDALSVAPVSADIEPTCDEYGRPKGEDVHWWINANLRQAAEIAARREWLTDITAAELQRIDDEFKREISALDRRYAELTEGVRRWHIDHPEVRTRPTPHGTIALTVYDKPKVHIDDRRAVIEWARSTRPDLIVTRTTETVHHDDLTKAARIVSTSDGGHLLLDETGAVVPGARVYVQEPVWSFRPTGSEDF